MSDKKDDKSFWTTLPGIFTGCAALLTAIGGLITALYAAGLLQALFPAAPTVVSPTVISLRPTGTMLPPTPVSPTAISIPPTATTLPPTPYPQLRTVSSGQEILKGSYTFDLDTGQQGDYHTTADIFWENVDDTVRYLNAVNGARFSYLGKVNFDQISANDLLTAKYDEARLNGSATAANQLTDGTVILVRTNRNSFCKLRIEKYGIAAPGDLPQWPKAALLIRWVTFSTQ